MEEEINIDLKKVKETFKKLAGYDMLVILILTLILIAITYLWKKDISACNSYYIEKLKDCIMLAR